MKEVLKFLLDNWDTGLMLGALLLELALRFIPSEKNRSILAGAFKIIDYLVVNRRKGGGSHTVKMIALFVLSSLAFSVNGQTNAMVKGIVSYNVDSATFKSTVNSTQAQYGDIGAMYYNKQASKWKIFYDSAWHDLIQSDTTFGVPGGSTGMVQFNKNGTFGGDNAFTWDSINNVLRVGLLRLHDTPAAQVFLGTNSGNLTNTGTNNVAIGTGTLLSLTDGLYNTAIGTQTGNAITGGDHNVALGGAALNLVSTGNDNTGIGYSALTLTTGTANTSLGGFAGDNITTGSNNLILGYNIDAQTATADNQLSIQNILFGVGNSGGGTTVSTGQLGIGAVNPSHQLTITGNANNKDLFLVEENSGADLFVLAETGGVPIITLETGNSTGTLRLNDGANEQMGVAVLVGGTLVVNNTKVTANSRILLTCQALGTVIVPSALCVSARTPGTSFTILASQATDTSTIFWQIWEPN